MPQKGTLVWSSNTTKKNDGRYITGPPYIIGDKVIIGHGGADFRPIRGYVTAYDLESGEESVAFFYLFLEIQRMVLKMRL